MSIEDQPPPKPNDSPAIWDLVIADMRERDHVGRQRYGTPLQANNGRDPLVDAYQEALDLAVYLRQAIEERDDPWRRALKRDDAFQALYRWALERGWNAAAESTAREIVSALMKAGVLP